MRTVVIVQGTYLKVKDVKSQCQASTLVAIGYKSITTTNTRKKPIVLYTSESDERAITA